MTATMRFAPSLRDNRASQIRNALDAASTPGKFLFYTAPVPATGAAITSQTLLGTCTLSKPCGTVADQTLTFAAITQDSLADATGDVAFVRAVDGDGVFVADLDATDEEGSGPVIMPSLHVYEGGTLSVTSAVIVEGNA